jgi:hypothetical protein
LQEIASAVEEERNASGGETGTWNVLKKIARTPTARKAVLLGCLLQFFQQVAK